MKTAMLFKWNDEFVIGNEVPELEMKTKYPHSSSDSERFINCSGIVVGAIEDLSCSRKYVSEQPIMVDKETARAKLIEHLDIQLNKIYGE